MTSQFFAVYLLYMIRFITIINGFCLIGTLLVHTPKAHLFTIFNFRCGFIRSVKTALNSQI